MLGTVDGMNDVWVVKLLFLGSGDLPGLVNKEKTIENGDL